MKFIVLFIFLLSSTAFTKGYWSKRPADLLSTIDASFEELTKAEHWGAKGFPCNGETVYQIVETNSNEVVKAELAEKEKAKFRAMDLGTASGSLLVSLKKTLDWNGASFSGCLH